MAVTAPQTYLADLNDAQREAVVTTEGPLLVVAGAGSGKTRVLTYRVAHLIHAIGVKPNEILAITFTNKAAGEMRERLAVMLGGTSRAIWILTFHSACGRILRREAERLGYRSSFTIYDDQDQLRLVKACLEELGKADPDMTGYELEAASDAKVVRVRDGERIVTDGPFAETKELIGGAFFADLPDLDEAIRLAALVPAAEYGSMEIRPIVEH